MTKGLYAAAMRIGLIAAIVAFGVGAFAADDDTDMLQSLLDKGGNISLPAKEYRISRKLLFRS